VRPFAADIKAWSFTRRVLSLAHQHLYQDVLPTESLIFDETTYELEHILFEEVIQLPASEFHGIDQIHGVVASRDNWKI
jgi:hypothetical protein